MKVIIIRGLPGTGKTTIAELIKKELPNSEIINADEFKVDAMRKGETFGNSKKISYKQSIKKLNEFYFMGKTYAILDELIYEEEFLGGLDNFIAKTNSSPYWFRLMRKLKYLLEIESKRNRKIKNTLEDFNQLKKDADSLEIKNEHVIKNDYLGLTVQKILDIIGS